ncbi:hypothetical protein HII31_00464 [Pseudocercospora fuligena]|uniref:DUF7730 domain-containing protein n=1 Tax=Pseudocercospora fuligena TaxID=685502 RepID=A0A8H6RVF7_9PEZI|nr:hypothetical protein HII31_00464 [Pseudocercospora fuligena]
MSSTTNQRPFPFLSLPPELRDQIYSHLLSTQHAIDIFRYQKQFTCTKSSDSNEENPEGVHIPVDILRTCRQIYTEATPILYGSNRFVFTFPGVFTSFMRGSRGARWMKDVEITYLCDRGDVLEALKALDTSVEKLERLALGGAIVNIFDAEQIAKALVQLLGRMRVVNGDRSVETTLSRVVFVPEAAYSTRSFKQLAERNRRTYEEEVKGLLRAKLEDEE